MEREKREQAEEREKTREYKGETLLLPPPLRGKKNYMQGRVREGKGNREQA